MIHYTCDLCKRTLTTGEARSELTMRLASAQPVAPSHQELVDPADEDNLEALDELLHELDDDEAADDSANHACELRFDLCCDCRKRFLQDPLGREALLKQLNFSSN